MSPADIASSIKLARKDKKLTQEQLAALLHVSRQTISNWENARSQPDYETLQQLAEHLDLDVATFFIAKPPVAQPDDAAPDCPSASQQEAAPTPIAPVPETIDPSDSAPAQTAVCDCVAASSQVVQPEKMPHLRRAAALAAALLIVLCAAIGFSRSAKGSPYTLEWFQQTRTPEEGKAFVRLYTKTEEIALMPALRDKPAQWQMILYFREENGVGFQIDQLHFIYFMPDGKTERVSYDTAYIASVRGSSHLDAYKMNTFIDIYSYPDPSKPAPLGAGCVLEGTDDNGHTLAFGLYIPFEQLL